MKKSATSFEFFPPKTADGIASLRETRAQLAKFDPEFFSVTFGAGGSTRDRTMDTVLALGEKPAAGSNGSASTRRVREEQSFDRARTMFGVGRMASASNRLHGHWLRQQYPC